MAKEAQNKWWFRDAPKEFAEELLRIDRVTRVTAWGRQLRFRASVVIWDGKGRVWLGLGKAWEVVVAIEKAVRDAKKNLVKFQITEWTIAHDVSANFKAAAIMLHPASEGTWIIAWWAVRKILSVSWIKDILAKRYGSNNPITNARATLKALSMIKFVEKKEKKIEENVSEKVIVEAPKAEIVKEEAPKVEKKPVVKKDSAPKSKTPTKKAAPKK